MKGAGGGCLTPVAARLLLCGRPALQRAPWRTQGIVPEAIFLDCYDAKGRVPAFLTGGSAPRRVDGHNAYLLQLYGLYNTLRSALPFQSPSPTVTSIAGNCRAAGARLCF